MQNKYKIGKIRTDNRAKIIAIAEKEFAEFGYKGASIMNIAKRANLPRANVHYYFNSKLELYKKVLFDILQLWNDVFNQITPEDDPADAIGAYIKAKVMYSKTNPLASKIFGNEIIHGAPRISEYLNSDFRDWLKSKSAVQVSGTVFELSSEEIAAADDYEVADYQRVRARLKSGRSCWIYAAANQ